MFRDIQADPDDAAAGSSAPAGPSVVVRREASVMGDEDLDERVAAMSCRVPPNLFSVPFLQPIKCARSEPGPRLVPRRREREPNRNAFVTVCKFTSPKEVASSVLQDRNAGLGQ